MTAKDVANAMERIGFAFRRAKQPHRIVESWVSKSRPYHPELLTAVALARVLNTTVEELVDGETGEQYLREYIQGKGWAFSTLTDKEPDVLGEDECDLLMAYNRLNETGKRAALDTVRGLYASFPLQHEQVGVSSKTAI